MLLAETSLERGSMIALFIYITLSIALSVMVSMLMHALGLERFLPHVALFVAFVTLCVETIDLREHK